MKQLLPAAAFRFAFACACACATGPLAEAQQPAPGAEPQAERAAGVVKLDIAEKVDGKPDRDTPAVYRLREKLRQLGYVAYTEKPLRADEIERRRHEKEAAARGCPPPTATAEARPAPDLVIKGLIDVSLSRTSTFYGQNVAYAYVGIVDLVVSDASGKRLAVIEDRDEWGRTEEKAAREEEHKRIAAFAAVGVLKSEPIRSRLSPKRQAAAGEYVAKIEKARQGGRDEAPAGEGGK